MCPGSTRFCMLKSVWQDVQLGGWEPMKQTQELLQKHGAFLSNWRIHTPICSPSRSETISGRYFHNIKSKLNVPPEKLQPAASGHVDGTIYKNDSVGVHLRRAGYQTAIFGKANFNTCEGFDRWFQGAFLGYGGSWQDNENPLFYTKAKETDYATALLGNKTLEWLNRPSVTGEEAGGRPFFVYFAPHCPHTPATPADWYAEACAGVTSPRLRNCILHHPCTLRRLADSTTRLRRGRSLPTRWSPVRERRP